MPLFSSLLTEGFFYYNEDRKIFMISLLTTVICLALTFLAVCFD